MRGSRRLIRWVARPSKKGVYRIRLYFPIVCSAGFSKSCFGLCAVLLPSRSSIANHPELKVKGAGDRFQDDII
jgi:hypothetical protein